MKFIKGTEAFARHGACRLPASTRDLLRNALDLVGNVISMNKLSKVDVKCINVYCIQALVINFPFYDSVTALKYTIE